MLAFLAATALASGASALDDYSALAMGRFPSEAQHASDPAYDWAEARVIRIWPERTDGVWLYQEQAIVNAPGLSPEQARAVPYSQFVARVTHQLPGVLRRDSYRVLDDAKWLCLSDGDPRLARLSPSDLACASCHNRLERVAQGAYTGRTESCANG